MPRYDDTFVGRFLEPWNRHDVDGALALMTDDCVWAVTRGREPHGILRHNGVDVGKMDFLGPISLVDA
jgi:ketosteroid isomerase-like protein